MTSNAKHNPRSGSRHHQSTTSERMKKYQGTCPQDKMLRSSLFTIDSMGGDTTETTQDGVDSLLSYEEDGAYNNESQGGKVIKLLNKESSSASMSMLESVEEGLVWDHQSRHEEEKNIEEGHPIQVEEERSATEGEMMGADLEVPTEGNGAAGQTLKGEPAAGRDKQDTGDSLDHTIKVPTGYIDDMSAMSMSQFRSMRTLTVVDDDVDDENSNSFQHNDIFVRGPRGDNLPETPPPPPNIDDDDQSMGFDEAVLEPTLEIEVPNNFHANMEMSALGMGWHSSSNNAGFDNVAMMTTQQQKIIGLDTSASSRISNKQQSSSDLDGSANSRKYHGGGLGGSGRSKRSSVKSILYRGGDNNSFREQTQKQVSFRYVTSASDMTKLAVNTTTDEAATGSKDAIKKNVNVSASEITSNAQQANTNTASGSRRSRRVNSNAQFSTSFTTAISSLGNSQRTMDTKPSEIQCKDARALMKRELSDLTSATGLVQANAVVDVPKRSQHTIKKSAQLSNSFSATVNQNDIARASHEERQFRKSCFPSFEGAFNEGNNDTFPKAPAPEPQRRLLSCNDMTTKAAAAKSPRSSFDQRRRSSSLVAPHSSIDASWFASHHLMSQKSFKRYKKEMKKDLMRSVTDGTNEMAQSMLSDSSRGYYHEETNTNNDATRNLSLLDLDTSGGVSELDNSINSRGTFRTAASEQHCNFQTSEQRLNSRNSTPSTIALRRSDFRNNDLDDSDRLSDIDTSGHWLGDNVDNSGHTFRTAQTSGARHFGRNYSAPIDSQWRSEDDFPTQKKQPRRSASMDDGLDNWVQSCTASFGEYDEEKKHAAFASLIQSVLTLPFQKSARLTSDEMAVLEKMTERLSSQYSDDGSNGSLQSRDSKDSLNGTDPWNEVTLEENVEEVQTHVAKMNGSFGEVNKGKPEESGSKDTFLQGNGEAPYDTTGDSIGNKLVKPAREKRISANTTMCGALTEDSANSAGEQEPQGISNKICLRDKDVTPRDSTDDFVGHKLAISTRGNCISGGAEGSVLTETFIDCLGEQESGLMSKKAGSKDNDAMTADEEMPVSAEVKGNGKANQELLQGNTSPQDILKPCGGATSSVDSNCETDLTGKEFVIPLQGNRVSGGTVVSVITEASAYPVARLVTARTSQGFVDEGKHKGEYLASMSNKVSSIGKEDAASVGQYRCGRNASTKDLEKSITDEAEIIEAKKYEHKKNIFSRDDSVQTGIGAVCEVRAAIQAKPQLSPKTIAKEDIPTMEMRRPGYSDIMTEGMNNLSLAMLVNIYGKLREMSILGHASVRLADIDVNSHQSLARKKQMKRLGLLKPGDESERCLDNSKTAEFIVRAVLDEYEMFETSNELCPLNQGTYHKANMAYDASVLQHFKSWVDESKSNQDIGGYFSKGSVMMKLLNSGLEVVWFSDRHPNDIIYCICVDKKSATVTLVFYGQDETALSRIKNSAMMKHTNPLAQEDFGGNSDFINLRAAVSDEMMRVRRDTRKSTIYEIREKVDKVGKELTNGGRYHLSITGHSLGGGLATVAGFYLASDPSLELASAVRLFTFASSRVGCRTFQQSFRYLEDTGRLLHARIANANDMISLRPFWDMSGSWRFDNWYQHVGIHVQLHVNNAQALDVSYDQDVGLFKELSDLIKSYFFGNVKRSRISEYQHRMHSSRDHWIAKNNEGGHAKRIRSLPSLDELYLMKDRLNPESTVLGGQSFYVYLLVSFFLSLEMALLLRFSGIGS